MVVLATLDPPFVQDIGAIPDVDFTWDPSPGCLDAPIQFTGTSAATIASWQWNFGDGGTAFQQNPMHTYNTPGVYTVTLLGYFNGWLYQFNQPANNSQSTSKPKLYKHITRMCERYGSFYKPVNFTQRFYKPMDLGFRRWQYNDSRLS